MEDDVSGHAAPAVDSRCLGWLCNWRDHCARHVTEHEVVLRRWFMPYHTAEHCEHYQNVRIESC